MKRRNKFVTALAVVLIFVTVYTLLATATFAGEIEDYSKPGTIEKTYFNSADILEAVLGEELSSVERDYLEEYGDYSISYGTHIPSSVVKVGRDEETGSFTVIAETYEYTAENGAYIVFVPARVTVGEKTVEMELRGEDGYVADFDASDYDENAKAIVEYVTEIELSEETLNALQNKAYYDSVNWQNILLEKEAEYVEALLKHEASILAYNEYLDALADFEAALVLHNNYREERILYEKNLALYNEYLLELDEYNEDLKAYRDYEAALALYNENYKTYQEYLTLKENFDSLLLKYQNYLKDLELVRSQLAILDGLKKRSTSLYRSVYDAVIIGTTVTEVLENKDAIANQTVGINPETVDQAGDATEALRALCLGYFELEGEAEKYVYYKLNYEAISSNFTLLFSALDKMYMNSKVRLVLKEKGLEQKYEILLAQLYYVVNALNDGPVYNYDKTAVYNSSYVVNTLTKVKPLTVLENVPYMTDTENATPLAGGYPKEEKEPVLIEVTEPAKPTYVAEPIAPEVVPDPGEKPTPVEYPAKPDPVKAPGEPPVQYVPDDTVLALIESLPSPRDPIVGSKNLEISVNVAKSLGVSEFYFVRFMSENGDLLHTAYAEKGTYAEFSGKLPTKSSDDRATYEFIGWMDSEGNIKDITSVESDLELYPCFREKIKIYTIYWNVEGVITETYVPYGDIPEFVGTPEKPDDGSYEYFFDGWDREIVPVFGNVTYTAMFRAESLYISEKGAEATVTRDDNGFFVELTNTEEKSFDLSKILPRVTKTDSVIIKTPTTKITLSHEAVGQIKTVGAKGITVDVEAVQGGYVISPSLIYESGAVRLSQVSSNAEIKVSIARGLGFTDAENISFYYLDGGTRVPVRATYKNGVLTASYTVGKTYYAVQEYSVNLLPSRDVSIEIGTAVAKKGDFIEVNVVSVADGVIVDKIYYLDSQGNKTEITDGGFYMLEGGVTIGVDSHLKEYTVIYKSDGEILHEFSYTHGESPEEPLIPHKGQDSEYSYEFVEWVLVSEDEESGETVYEAKFEKIPLPPKEGPAGIEVFPGYRFYIQVTPSLFKTAAKILILAFYFLFLLVPMVFVIIIKAVKRARR